MTTPSPAPVFGEASPAFRKFLEHRKRVEREQPDVRIWCETRIVRALADLAPRPAVQPDEASARKIHRCDLAKLWVKNRHLDASVADFALVTSGVRHALSMLFKLRLHETVAIPSDVYPVYWSLAQSSGCSAVPYNCFPSPDLDRILSASDSGAPRLVLVCNPLKLQGRALNADEVRKLLAWLRGDCARRLMIDGVYSSGNTPPDSTLEFLRTGQAWLLDSLSKSWLHEQVFGVALVPEADSHLLKPAFAELQLDQSALQLANVLLTEFADFPDTLASKLCELRELRLAEIRASRIVCLPPVSGYLITCNLSAQELLAVHRVLALPMEVFGSTLQNWSVISALPAGESVESGSSGALSQLS